MFALFGVWEQHVWALGILQGLSGPGNQVARGDNVLARNNQHLISSLSMLISMGAACVIFLLLDHCVLVLSSPLCSSLGQELIL